MSHVAHKYRASTLFNDQMNEVSKFVRSRKALWRAMIANDMALCLRPLYWGGMSGKETIWLMEMSFKDKRGNPAHWRKKPCPPQKSCTNGKKGSYTAVPKVDLRLRTKSKPLRSCSPKSATRGSTGANTRKGRSK